MDKVIISHRGALLEKYGDEGLALIESTIDELIAADANRGLQAELVYIDDAVMQQLGGKPSVREGRVHPDSPDPAHQKEGKDAADTIALALSPTYLMLLDGQDVIPHIVLENPAFGILELGPTERTIASDLPYASSARFSGTIADYLSITRAVGRVPNVPGSDDPNTIVQYLRRAAAVEPRPVGDYQSFFTLSSEEFKNSTGQTISALQGTVEFDIAPPAGPPATDGRFARLSHFINCHGDKDTAEFYGQQHIVAMSSSQVAARTEEGTVVAAECCYGAQLYDPKLAKAEAPICISYIAKGALGFFGSTDVAFGGTGSTPNARADLITRFFFENVLAGASLGKAVMEARQKFIDKQLMDGGNLKTLAQFILLGDPSVIPCKLTAAFGLTAALRDESEVKDRAWKARLADAGQRIAEKAVIPTGGPISVPESVKQKVRGIAQDSGYGETEETLLPISDWTSRDSGPNKAGECVMVIRPRAQTGSRQRYLVAHIVGEDIVQVEEAESRLASQK